MPDDEERPPERTNNFTVPMDEDMLKRSVKRAGSPSRLRAVIRALLFLTNENEYPYPPDDVIKQQERRAKKKRRG